MSCRSTPANSAATTFARLNCDLTDVQTLSAFHVLRAEAGRDAPVPSRQEWRQWLATERRFVQAHPNLTKARRASLLRRLDAARTQPVPDGQTWSALTRMRPFTQAQSRELRDRYQSLADRLGIDPATVRDRAAAYAAEVDTRRDAPPPPGYTPEHLSALRTARLPVDRQTVYALTRLEQEADLAAARTSPRTTANRRIVRQPVASSAIAEVGYDPDGGRLEIVFHSHADRVYAYRNVPPAVWEQISGKSAGRAYHVHIRNNPAVRYPNAAAAEADAYRRQCTGCGQFTGSGHVCPTRSPDPTTPVAAGAVTGQRKMLPRSIAGRTRRNVTDPHSGIRTVLPEVTELHQETRTGPVTVTVEHTGDPREDHSGQPTYTLTGALTVLREDEGTLGVDTAELACSCPAYQAHRTCPHIDAYARAALRRINPAAAGAADILDAQAAAATALAQDWTRSKHYAAEARKRWAPGADTYYSTDLAAFEADAAAARAAARGWAKNPDRVGALTYQTENATDGLLTEESGRRFGVEIEFDFPDTWSAVRRQKALAAIGADLHALGLTTTPEQQEYGAAKDAARDTGHRSTEHAGGWAFEKDTTCAGEIISPPMLDEPETWRLLPQVCAIVKAHGGIASPRTGSHVHIGAASYGTDLTNHTELMRLVNQHEDVLYRLGQNPADRLGEHRPLRYCQPNSEVPLAGYVDLDKEIEHDAHHRALNLESVTGTTDDHIEFRHFDATLDPSIIQAQIKLSAAAVVAAQRAAATHGSKPRPREALGAHHARNADALRGSRRKMTRDERDADTASTRSLIDTLFLRREDKAQIAGLYALTRWQRRNRS